MSNFFLQILIILKSIPRHLRKINLRFVLTSILLLVFGFYYYLCQEIPTSERTIRISRIAGNDSVYSLQINLSLNCSAFGNTPNFGTSGNTITIYAEATDQNTDILKPDKQEYSDLREIYRPQFLQHYPESSVNSIDAIYQVDFTETHPFYYIIHRLRQNSRRELISKLTDVFTYFPNHKHARRNNLFAGDTITTYAVIGYNHILPNAIDLHMAKYRQLNYWVPCDISQMYHRINFDLSDLINDRTKVELSFDFGGHTIFSAMNPTPDRIEMSKIIFTNPQKIHQILTQGNLIFHTEFSDNKNLQSSKSFFITTILSMLAAYWFALVGKFIHNHSLRRKQRKH